METHARPAILPSGELRVARTLVQTLAAKAALAMSGPAKTACWALWSPTKPRARPACPQRPRASARGTSA
eukprot:9290106-Alexandrium_andersonii.AAC.1